MLIYGSSEGQTSSKYHYYALGDGSFTANFASRTISGNMEYDYVARGGWPDDVYLDFCFGCNGRLDSPINFSGDISGNSFSGDISWGDSYGEGDFKGLFYGPDASEIGGVFNLIRTYGLEDDDGISDVWFGTGTFVGCQSC